MCTCPKGSFYVVTSNQTDVTAAVCDDLNRKVPCAASAKMIILCCSHIFVQFAVCQVHEGQP